MLGLQRLQGFMIANCTPQTASTLSSFCVIGLLHQGLSNEEVALRLLMEKLYPHTTICCRVFLTWVPASWVSKILQIINSEQMTQFILLQTTWVCTRSLIDQEGFFVIATSQNVILCMFRPQQLSLLWGFLQYSFHLGKKLGSEKQCATQNEKLYCSRLWTSCCIPAATFEWCFHDGTHSIVLVSSVIGMELLEVFGRWRLWGAM